MIARADVWWVDLEAPRGSEPGFARPMVVIQGNALNRGRLPTTICVALTSNLKWAAAAGNVLLSARSTGLSKDSVANVSQIATVDKSMLIERAGQVPAKKFELILAGIDVVLGRA